MANTLIAYEEMRFDVRDEQVTHCYVLIKNLSGDGMLGVQGWHYKAFPARMSVRDIMNDWFAGKEDPLMWPQKSPEEK
jgi:hypothetical protein